MKKCLQVQISLFWLGLIVLALGACISPMNETKPGNRVALRIPLPAPQGSRTLTDKQVEALADYYEVIFKKILADSSAEYISSSAERGKDFLSVEVEADKSTVGNIKPLVEAEAVGITAEVFKQNVLTLESLDDADKDFFDSVNASVDDMSISSSEDIGTITTVYTILQADLPNQDCTGKLYFDLTYYGFSDPNADQEWHIRNGLNLIQTEMVAQAVRSW